MPRAIPPRSQATVESADEQAERSESPRSRHVVDRGLEYRALARQGMTPLAIQRRKRKSKAYVSIVVRFGALLETLDPIEVAVLRHPRITYKVLQRVVRTDADDRQVVRALREAITMPKTDGRRRRRLKLAPAPLPADPDAFTFRWDAEWAGRDPIGYLESLEAYLRRVQRGVDHRMKRLLAAPSVGVADGSSTGSAAVPTASLVARGGGSIRAISAALRKGPGGGRSYRPSTDAVIDQAVRGRLVMLDEVLRRLERRAADREREEKD